MRARDLVVEVGGRRLLGPVDLEVRPGELVALTGPSGSGKTVLSRVLLGLWDRPVSGRVERAPAAWVPQEAALDPLAPLEANAATLARLEVPNAPAHTLSGGEAKRASLARALDRKRPFLVVDEPLTGVDAHRREAIVALLREVAHGGTGVLWITHDIAHAAAADRVLALEDGRVGPAEPSAPPPWPRPTASPGEPVVEARGVGFGFGDRTLLHAVDLTIAERERVGLVGPSGSGKTTLGRLLVGLLAPRAGAIAVCGEPPRPGRLTQWLPQRPGGLLPEGVSLQRIVAASARLHGGDADVALQRMDLRGAASPETLSGGERRRGDLARIALAHPRFWVADEPGSGLDAPLRARILATAFEALEPAATLLITHDEKMAEAVCHRVVRLRDGRLEAG